MWTSSPSQSVATKVAAKLGFRWDVRIPEWAKDVGQREAALRYFDYFGYCVYRN